MSRPMRMASLTVVIVVALIGNILTFDFVQSSDTETGSPRHFTVGLVLGCYVAQLGLLGMWCALANQPALVRFTFAGSLISLACSAWLLGWRIQGDEYHLGVVILVIGAASMTFLLGQLPLWFLRLASARRIALKSQTSTEGDYDRTKVHYLFAFAATVTFLVTIDAAAHTREVWGNLEGLRLVIVIIFLLAVVGYGGGAAAAISIPCILLTLFDRSSTRAVGGLMLLSPLAVIPLLFDDGDELSSSTGQGSIGFVIALVGMTCIGLYVIRFAGFRMVALDRQG